MYWLSDLTAIQIATSTASTAEMGSGGAINVAVYNAYGQGCGTPWLYGPSAFQLGYVFTDTSDCIGFIMPNKVILYIVGWLKVNLYTWHLNKTLYQFITFNDDKSQTVFFKFYCKALSSSKIMLETILLHLTPIYIFVVSICMTFAPLWGRKSHADLAH